MDYSEAQIHTLEQNLLLKENSLNEKERLITRLQEEIKLLEEKPILNNDNKHIEILNNHLLALTRQLMPVITTFILRANIHALSDISNSQLNNIISNPNINTMQKHLFTMENVLTKKFIALQSEMHEIEKESLYKNQLI